MTFGNHCQSYDGKQVYDFEVGQPLRDPASHVPRFRIDYDDQRSMVEILTTALSDPASEHLEAVIIGAWMGDDIDMSTSTVVETLVAASEQLPKLRALFLGDVIYEECEVSWLVQSDVSPLWPAFQQLRRFDVRGANELSLGEFTHDQLETFVLESGGTGKVLLAELASAKLPSLRHLEIYLGDTGYGWDGGPDDIQQLLDGVNANYPHLARLGLRNCATIDELVGVVAAHPLLERIEELDLSLGTLGDEGAEILLSAESVRNLKKLDLHYHFMSPTTCSRFETLPCEVNLGDPQEADGDYRYVSVSE